MKKIETNLKAIRLNRADWYKREDFLTWLNKTDSTAKPATWHISGQPAGDFSDAFTIYDQGEGPDSDLLPEDIWAEIDRACRAAGITYGIVWIVNMEANDE
jgi:hypothetical protein